MHIVISLFAIIICFLCVVGIHEWGHALAATYFGVKIKRITLGFGKPLRSWPQRAGYTLDVCLWPLGGCVHLFNTRVAPVAPHDYPYCFDKKSIGVRTIILLSGAIANIITAGGALLLMLMIGYKQLPPIVASVTVLSHAAAAGLKAGDRITHVANHATPFWRDVSMQLIMHLGEQNVAIAVCSSQNDCRTTTLDLKLWHKQEESFELFSAIGITPDISDQHVIHVRGLSFFKACIAACSQLLGLVCFFIVMIKQILTSQIPFAALIGPFKLFQAIIDSFSQGLAIFLYFIANFSLAMALINLLPIPGLDGGSILYGLIEKIRGKPLSIALEVLIHQLLFIVFALVMFQLVMNDLHHYM